jgi:hypothetical protein
MARYGWNMAGASSNTTTTAVTPTVEFDARDQNQAVSNSSSCSPHENREAIEWSAVGASFL